jgi:N utilization substance protein A
MDLQHRGDWSSYLFSSDLAIVPDDQLSLAIGKLGQNVKLAVQACGWSIDIKSEQNAANEGILY